MVVDTYLYTTWLNRLISSTITPGCALLLSLYLTSPGGACQ